MRLLQRRPDGGNKSGVTAHFLVEWKGGFSVALLHFRPGTREAFHEHAFNAITAWLWGYVLEHHLEGGSKLWHAGHVKLTRRNTFHKVEALGHAWALTVRGPWVDRWREYRDGRFVTLTHGRQEVPQPGGLTK